MPPDAEPNAEQIVEICAWAHAEWMRIHPFANGNGRLCKIEERLKQGTVRDVNVDCHNIDIYDGISTKSGIIRPERM